MANRFQLDLKTFEISSLTPNILLSMTSVAFIYDVPLQNITQDNLSSLIQSKQLWLLPRGLCRLDVRMQLGECDIREDERAGFFEFIADTICQSFLGLSVEILEVEYHQEEDNVPNLYFSIEQSDMSSALLSPPHAYTAQIKGVECILRFKSSSHLMASPKQEEQVSSQPRMTPPIEASAGYHTLPFSDVVDPWENAARLVEAALCITFGTRKRMQGLKIIEFGKAPSLLDLAPAVWNSDYLRSTLNYTKNFAVISNILASSLKGQSPELRRKAAGLIKDNIAEENDNPGRGLEQQTKQLESLIQRKLWALLQDTLKPTIGTSNTTRKSTLPNAELDYQEYEMDKIVIDEGIIDQYGLLDESHSLDESLLQESGQDYDDYGSNTNYNPEIEFACEHDDNLTLPFQDHKLHEAEGFRNGLGNLYHEAGTSYDQILEPGSQPFESEISYNIQDYVMSGYIYDEDDDLYGYEYDDMGYAGQEPSRYELAAISNCWEDQEKDIIHRGAMEEGIHEPDADEDML
ncbi:hypothetical protein CHU98_g6081 [Xylaria longipes]|nr:hypothetical protein CHU98_g6081 [Xylaria longipes]